MKSLEERSIYDLFFNSPDIVIVEGELKGQVREFRIYTKEEIRKLESPSIIEYAELKQKIEKLEKIKNES